MDSHSLDLGRFDTMIIHRFLQLSDTQPGHVQFMFDLPQMSVTNRIAAPMMLNYLGRLKYRTSECQWFSYKFKN